MPSFCRHNRLLQNCPICTKEQNVEMQPAVTRFGGPEPGANGRQRTGSAAPARTPRPTGARARTATRQMTVRRLARTEDDGFQSALVPGLRSAPDAQRLADELAFAAARCARLAADPPGLYAELADPAIGIEERSWLAFELAWLSPSDQDEPFAAIERARVPWTPEGRSAPAAEPGAAGPRGSYDPRQPGRTAAAYRGWAARAGSQAAAYAGDSSWTPERRFDRVFERLALPGIDRAVRYDLLVTLGCTGAYQLHAGSLHLGGSDPVTLAAKRLLGIGDPIMLERRAAELARATTAPLQALDLAFFNWERRDRWTAGMPDGAAVDETVRAGAYAALGLS